MISLRLVRVRAAWVVLVVTLAVGAVTAVLPDVRSPAVVVASVVSPLLVLAGVRLHRPASPVWWLLSLMLALWGAASILVQRDGQMSGLADALVGAGQAVGAIVTVHVARARSQVEGGPGQDGPRAGGRVDGVLIATVLALVGAQLMAAGTASGGSLSPLLVPIVDVTIIGVLLRYTVSRRGLQPSSYLTLAATLLTTAYDLSSAVQGRRLALPGEPAQVLGVCCVLLFGVAALHPSMTSTFSAETYARRQRPSGALLGLLPLAVVPLVLWLVANLTGTPPLPALVLLVAGAVMSGLCLVRAAQALRTSEHQAERDPLTDLANRRGLDRAFLEPPPSCGRSMLLVDVDEFKQVNDTHGHDVGDELLLRVRDRLVRSTGTAGLVARLGGDEFVVLVRSDQAAQVADSLLRSMRVPVVLNGLNIRITASVGLAVADDSSLSELLTRADVAMYCAKAAGRNRLAVFEPSMRTEVARRFSLTSEVRQLLHTTPADVGRLEVHYQPLVELRSGQVVGAEALVRWSHPKHGLLAPDAFLGAVSTSGLDVELDTAVLRTVLSQLASWREQGRRELPVSVNLTAASLADPTLARRVAAELSTSGVPARQLHLEITEHQELPTDSPAERSLRDLRAIGVRIYLDDYGAGYTSLDYLSRFPVEVLKLDRALVTSMSQGTPLVAGVAAMAAALDLDLLAEGVETEQQRQQLLELGVRYAQGWLFSKPLPADEYAHHVLEPPTMPTLPAQRQNSTTRAPATS